MTHIARCIRLFWIHIGLSACTFGGGFVIISMTQRKFADELGWIDADELLDMAAISQSAPGSLALNMAVAVGYRIEGIAGALAAAFGTLIPPLIIISLISFAYEQFRDNAAVSLVLQVMRAGVAAVIFDVVMSLAARLYKTRSMVWIALIPLVFIAYFFFKISAALIIIICAVIGALYTARTTQ